MSSLVAHQVKDQFVTAVALVTTMVQVQSLAWELMHAMRMVKKKKKAKFNLYFKSMVLHSLEHTICMCPN